MTGLVALALVARRDDFPFRGDPAAQPSAMSRLAGLLLFALGYGVIALWTYRMSADLASSPFSALLDTLRAMGGRLPGDADYLPGEFADWFPSSILSITAIGVIWAAAWRCAAAHGSWRALQAAPMPATGRGIPVNSR